MELLKDIVEDIKKVFDVDLIEDQSRDQKTVYARKVYCVTARRQGYTLKAIGDYIRRSHCLVSVSVIAHQDNMEFNSVYRSMFNRWESRTRKEVNLNHLDKANSKIQALTDELNKTKKMRLILDEVKDEEMMEAVLIKLKNIVAAMSYMRV